MNTILELVKKETGWKSPSRLIGEACERYVVQEIRCPRCLHTKSFARFPTNEKFKDSYCNHCFQSFQIKKGDTNSLLGGDYFTTINNLNQVDFLVVKQSSQVFHIPHEKLKKHMVVPRKPLSKNARRAGWQGCVLRFPPDIQSELLYWKAKRPRSLKQLHWKAKRPRSFRNKVRAKHHKVQTVRRSRRNKTRKGPQCRQCPVCTADT
jgi:type II restriction enzyme